MVLINTANYKSTLKSQNGLSCNLKKRDKNYLKLFSLLNTQTCHLATNYSSLEVGF